MPLLPPELARAYASSVEKDADWHLLLQRSARLQEWIALEGVPQAEWPEADAAKLRAAAPSASESPSQRLSRWSDVFADELSELERAVETASSLGGPGRVTDIDLRTAVYLAGRLLATLYGVSVDQL